MTKKYLSKILILVIIVGVFGIYHLAYSVGKTTTTTVGNQSPVFTVTPSDGGSDNGSGTCSTDANPTCAGSNVTFTATAKDINTDNYYLAVCKTDEVAEGAPPTCPGAAWGVSTATVSDAEATKAVTTAGVATESNAWWAFVCDASTCFPADGNGDQGSAKGTITFTDVPVDAARVTVDSKIFEYDLTDGATCTGGQNVCLNCSTCEDGADAAAVLAAGTPTANYYWTSRGAVTYVYAEASGTGGNAIALSESGDSGNNITLPANLSGGDDENNSPFYVDHAPTFGTVAFTDTTDSSTITPGETVRFKLANDQIDDTDTDGGQDTINMYVCSGAADMGGVTSAFDYSANTCTGGTKLCQHLAVNPTTTDATCDDTTSRLTVPVAHGSYPVKVYVEDNHDMAGTGTTIQNFTVSNVAPTLDATYGGGDGYDGHTDTINDSDKPAAGTSAAVSWTARVSDLNGDGDIDSAKGELFDDFAANKLCSANEKNCYLDAACSLEAASSGSGHEATGTDALRIVTCNFTVWFNANVTTGGTATWIAFVKPKDGDPEVTTLADSGSDRYTMPPIRALDITQASIAYGTVEIGGTSASQTTTVENKGNLLMDFTVDGDLMTSGGNNIPIGQQKWHQTSSTFDWDAAASDPGPWVLVDTAATNAGEISGCVNRDIAVRPVHDSGGSSDESIYWKIRIPGTQAAGVYTGTNTFAATADTGSGQCTGTIH